MLDAPHPVLFQFTLAPYEYGTAEPSVPTMDGTSVTFDHFVPKPLMEITPALALFNEIK
jgi:hypothetical protein